MKTYFVGIDFSAATFNAAILRKEANDPTGTLLGESKFPNDREGVMGLRDWIETFLSEEEDFSAVLACGEDTGVYSRLLPTAFSKMGIDFWLQNALSIKNGRGDICRKKDDKADAVAIAEYACTFREKAKPFQPLTEVMEELRDAHSFRRHLVCQRTAVKNRIDNEKERLNARPESEVLTHTLKALERQKKALDKEIKRIDKLLLKLIESDPELKSIYGCVTSVKGIGKVTAVILIVVTNCFTRFDNYRQLASYFGVAPFPHQSGKMDKGNHRSHFADSYLASILTMGARAAIKWDPKIRAYAERLLKKGKPYMVVINNVRYKLLKYAFVCAKRRLKYDPNFTNPIFNAA